LDGKTTRGRIITADERDGAEKMKLRRPIQGIRVKRIERNSVLRIVGTVQWKHRVGT